MKNRRLVILKLLTCTVGGAVLTPALLYVLALLTPARDNVPRNAPSLPLLVSAPCTACFAASYGHTDIRWNTTGWRRCSIQLDSC